MADRDYRVTYKTREVEDDRPRRRVPTALDPYLYPDDRDELKRNVALARVHTSRYNIDDREPREFESGLRRETIRDDVSASTARGGAQAGATKTTYSVTSAGLEKESEVSVRVPKKAREPTVVAAPSPSPLVSRRSEFREVDDVELERERTTTMPVRTVTRESTRGYDDQEYSRYERVYDVERPRKENGVYIIDARDADVYYGGSREADRGFGGYRNDVYEDDYRGGQSRAGPTRESDYRQNEVVYSSRDDYRASASSVHSGAPYMSGARLERVPTAGRSQTALNGPSRVSTRKYEDDRATISVAKGPSRQSARRDEEDFAFVEKRDVRAPSVRESFKDPFQSEAPAPPPETPRGRARSSMYSMSPSEDEYVMVSPPQQCPGAVATARASSAGDALRSAMFREDKYTPEQRRQRRRSRRISFRAHEADDHYAGDRYHEPPGQEAAECGRYLQSYGGKRGGGEVVYSSRSKRDDRDYEYRSRGSKMEEIDYDRREKDSTRYAPQKMRSRSRRRRGSDDKSYISKNYEKTIKTTYY